MTLNGSDEDLADLLAYVRPALPAELAAHLAALRLRAGSIEADADQVPVLHHLRVNVGLAAVDRALAVRVVSLHHWLPILGWVSASHDALAHLPWVGERLRALEAAPVRVPGVRFREVGLAEGSAVLTLERE